MRKRPSDSRPAIQLLDKGVMRLESELGDLAVSYRLARSRRALCLRLTINRQNEVVLTLPAGCSLDRGMRFMRTKTEWLRRHLVRAGPPETLYGYLRKQGFVAVDGREAPIEWDSAASRPALKVRAGKLSIAFNPRRHGEAELKSLMRQLAAAALPRRTHELAAAQELSVNKVTVRDQVSRWGSCSAKRNISLNWRLLLLTPEVQDYVIWHELAHLVVMNHSNRYWKVLERFEPEALRNDSILTQITARVMAIGRVANS